MLYQGTILVGGFQLNFVISHPRNAANTRKRNIGEKAVDIELTQNSCGGLRTFV
jgi:hypothetical protein